jgi:Uma2 family endonuclease
MQRKFNLYRTAGVREYWVLENEHKTLTVYIFDNENVISRTYDEKDTAPVSVLNGLSIVLEPVFTFEEETI